MQIKIKDNGKKEILKKNIINTEKYSILFINYKTILFTQTDKFSILTPKQNNCLLF